MELMCWVCCTVKPRLLGSGGEPVFTSVAIPLRLLTTYSVERSRQQLESESGKESKRVRQRVTEREAEREAERESERQTKFLVVIRG